MECTNKLKINEYISMAQLKRRVKNHLIELGYSEFKPSIFSKGLVICLVMILEEMLTDCIQYIDKNKLNGLYTIDNLKFNFMLNENDKYDFCLKYKNKYNKKIKYHESLFFNIYKVMNNLESKHGDKLMIDSEVRNLICYYLLCLQYEIIELSLKVIKYCNKKTLNNNILLIILEHYISEETINKIKLKLDSSTICRENEDQDEEDEEEEEENEEDEDNEEDEEEA